MNKNNNNNNNNDDEKTSSLALDLESLNSTYKTLLVRYNQAVLDYIDNIKAHSLTPCGKYDATDKGIDQQCYDEIWKKAGCTTTGMVDANNSWAKKRTLNELIEDSFIWATSKDIKHRRGCYGHIENPYTIIGVGTDGRLYRRNGLDAHWEKTPGDANSISGICTGTDGHMLIWCAHRRIFTKPNWESTEINATQNDCCKLDIAMGQDGTLIGIGTDHQLWTKPDLNGRWRKTASRGEWVSAVCIAPDGSVFCIGRNQGVFKKNSYLNLASQSWQYMGDGTRSVISITIAPDGTFIGIGTNHQIYTKDNYKDLSTPWNGPYKDSCCIRSITCVINEKYGTQTFSTAEKPNYVINAPNYTQIESQAFWGESPLSESVDVTIDECKASCANDINCSGATFNAGNNTCYLRSGPGSPIPADENDRAIIPESAHLLSIVDSINSELNSVNQKIQKKIAEVGTIVSEKMRKLRGFNLIDEYNGLKDKRKKIDALINKYQTLEQSQYKSSLYSTQSYYVFYILCFLAFIFILVLASFSIDKATSEKISFAIQPAIKGGISGVSAINPYYVLFAIILMVSGFHLYNQYVNAVYNSMPSVRTIIIYLLFGLFFGFVGYNYLSKNKTMNVPNMNVPNMNVPNINVPNMNK